MSGRTRSLAKSSHYFRKKKVVNSTSSVPHFDTNETTREREHDNKLMYCLSTILICYCKHSVRGSVPKHGGYCYVFRLTKWSDTWPPRLHFFFCPVWHFVLLYTTYCTKKVALCWLKLNIRWHIKSGVRLVSVYSGHLAETTILKSVWDFIENNASSKRSYS